MSDTDYTDADLRTASREYIALRRDAQEMSRLARQSGDPTDHIDASTAHEASQRAKAHLDQIKAVIDEKNHHARMAELNAKPEGELTMQELSEVSRYNRANRSAQQIAWDDRVEEYEVFNRTNGRDARDKITGPRRSSGYLPIEGYEDVVAHLEKRKAESDEHVASMVDEIMRKRNGG
jgi:hypothetical protein